MLPAGTRIIGGDLRVFYNETRPVVGLIGAVETTQPLCLCTPAYIANRDAVEVSLMKCVEELKAKLNK